MYRNLLCFLLLFLFVFSAFPQSKKFEKQNKAALELSKSLEESKSDDLLALDYEKLAKELVDSKEYVKAEENYIKAKNLYIKLKNDEKVASIDREIAKIQELQNKVNEAISSYQSASRLSKSKAQQAINQNDAQRLMNQSNSVVQSDYIQQNIEILEKSEDKKERADAYSQMAQVNLDMDQPEEAISNYKTALKDVEDVEKEIFINQKIADVYASNSQLDKAIEINEQLIEKAKQTNNPKLEIEQLRNLSSNYFENSDQQKGLESLQQAYDLAIDKNQTFDAKENAELLADYYLKNKRSDKALGIYTDFISKLESLVASDSSLVDSKIFQVNEEKITQLEKERELKDQLIRKKNSYNNVLIGVIILILIFLFFIIRAWFAIRHKNKKIALQSLRREMNPHFIFNSLNSVNQFIAQNNELEANKYLSSYSRLMRNVMENSNKDFIPLSLELAQMKEYLQLEHMRFADKFDYTIDVADNMDTDTVLIPNMLIQPQLENAIWHGLRYCNTKGYLILRIYQEDNNIMVVIDDNGIGIEGSKKLKTTHQKEHKSRGLTNTFERIELLNTLYHTHIQLDIQEKVGEETGVIVTIKIPILHSISKG